MKLKDLLEPKPITVLKRPPSLERVVDTSGVITGQSDKLRATHILWHGRGYGHNKGADKKNALKLIKLFSEIWHFAPEEIVNALKS